MKKSMIFVGMLAIGYANAQEYDGNVGINTDQPKATLDIQPNAENLGKTTNEGLLIPRLSKARVAAIASGNLVEGTKVYVTDEVTAADTQFIGTGKGFYFYNGTKWVKQLASDTNASDAIWIKDGADAKLDYPKSNYTTKYLSNGGYETYPTQDTKFTSIGRDNSRVVFDYDFIQNVNALHKRMMKYSDIKIDNPEYNGDALHSIYVIDKDLHNTNGGTAGFSNRVFINGDNIMQGKEAYSSWNNVEHLGNTRLSAIMGTYSSAALNGLNSSANTVTGGLIDAVTNSNADVGTIYGLRGRIRLNGAGTIDRLVGLRSEIALRGQNTEPVSSNIKELQGLYIGHNGLGNERYTGTIDKAYDIYVEAANYDGLKKRTKEAYGIYVNGGHKVNYLAGSLGIGINTPTAKLDAVHGSARIAGKYFHKTSTTSSIPANTKEVITVRDVITDYQGTVTDAGTELQTSRTYEIQLNAQSDTYYMDSRYIVFYDNKDKVWKSKLVSMNDDLGVQLAIAGSGNQIEVWHNRPATYTLRATIVSTDTHSTAGASTYSFGLDGAMTNLGGNVGVGTEAPTEKLEVAGKIKATSLAGVGNRNVYADENGVLQVGNATATSAGATTLTGEASLECNATNRGKMNFIQGEDGKSDVFGICMKNKNGNYYWGYMVGGNNPTNGTGAFGSGL